MLSSIILFLALVSLVLGLCSLVVNYTAARVEENSINLQKVVYFLIISSALFSWFYYLIH